MRVLWFSNSPLANKTSNATGTWLQTMSEALTEKSVEIYNITQSCFVNQVKYEDLGNIKQWVLPVWKLGKDGLPSSDKVNQIVSIVESINADIVHIWGTEFYWGLLSARGYIKGKILLEIEGLIGSCVDVFYGGLSFSEILSTIHLKELISFSRSIIGQKSEFAKWAIFEKEVLENHSLISTQSDWVRGWISPHSKHARIFNTGLIVRDAFYESAAWNISEAKENVIFALASGADPYKGLHIILKAFALLVSDIPSIQLRLAGNFGIDLPSYRKPGYTKFISDFIKKNKLSDKVIFLGPLTAEELSKEMRIARVMVQASNVESYSMALAEAMAVGVPVVASYAGAMPELAKDKESAIFYTMNDYRQCSFKIKQLLSNLELQLKLSSNARKIAEQRNKKSIVVKKQLDIYNHILND